ncbi:sigma-E processing peptidase SpoIIGA [Oscillospiraceae bacterium WX1]
MKPVIYVDELFLLNCLINYLLLLLTARICSVPSPRLRLFGAAALGGLYAVAAVLPLPNFIVHPIVKASVGVFMVLVSFGGQKKLLRLSLVFFAVAVAFGGAVLAAELLGGGDLLGSVLTPASLRVLLPAFIITYFVLTLVFRRAARHTKGGGVVALRLRSGDREVSLRALRDTGNALVDPMTGKPVIIAGVGDVKALFPPGLHKTVTALRLKDAVNVLEELCASDKSLRFQLVPYSAVGVPGSMLLAFRPDEVVIDGQNKTGMLLALSPNSVSENGTYAALLGA